MQEHSLRPPVLTRGIKTVFTKFSRLENVILERKHNRGMKARRAVEKSCALRPCEVVLHWEMRSLLPDNSGNHPPSRGGGAIAAAPFPNSIYSGTKRRTFKRCTSRCGWVENENCVW
ncbi:hypothetical protein TNCV_3831541 [Trichonephila clavipes]|nr:hypothetical protein TNCV_3831541 [Trichonephila clavipes]